MEPRQLLVDAIDPAIVMLIPLGVPRSDAARVEMLSISGQEADWTARVQDGGGPAHGLWQFERGGGVAGVLAHPASKDKIWTMCGKLGVACTVDSVYHEIIANDLLAACMARLLLWTDATPLPAVGDVEGGWNCYLRNWRPGAPRPKAWPSNYAAALDALKGVIT